MSSENTKKRPAPAADPLLSCGRIRHADGKCYLPGKKNLPVVKGKKSEK